MKDAHLRETEAMDNKIGKPKLLNEYYEGSEDINWLRKLRNSYVHFDFHNTAIEMNVQYTDREKLDQDATLAVKMVIIALFQNLGT